MVSEAPCGDHGKAKRRGGVYCSLSILVVVSTDRALCLPTFSHLLTVIQTLLHSPLLLCLLGKSLRRPRRPLLYFAQTPRACRVKMANRHMLRLCLRACESKGGGGWGERR